MVSLNTSYLASIWASSAIGVLVGPGFFAAAILLTLLLLSLMMVALRSRPEPHSLFELSRKLREVERVDCLQISHARN